MTTLASGIAFFVVLAVFPGIAAVVALHSLFGSPKLDERVLSTLPNVLPGYAVEVIARQIRYLSTSGAVEIRRLGVTSAIGLTILLVSANRGTTAMFRGLNVVYGRPERRGRLAFTAVSLAFTLGIILFLVFAIVAVVLLPGLLRSVGLQDVTAQLATVLRWPVIFLVVAGALAVVYPFATARAAPNWRSIALGSAVASLLWVCASLLFSFVVSRLGRWDELYGSVGTLIAFMLWVWLSVTIVLIGAEIDATASDDRDG